jgi:hypothetical protein
MPSMMHDKVKMCCSIRINQLLVSVTRWLRGFHKCFAAFFKQKSVNNLTIVQGREKISTNFDSLEFFKSFDVSLTNWKKSKISL